MRPVGYSGLQPTPLVIAMHGGFGNAYNLQTQSGLSSKADAENFIVVYPEGVSNLLNIRTWNAGWCCGYASNNNIDDVGFISLLIDSMISKYNIDTTSIYATGMSNGGFMSYRLACELSNRIAAIAPVAADMSVPTCNPIRPVSIIQFHSYLDSSVVYYGGIGNGVSNHYNSPHDSVLNAWSMKNGCSITNDTIINNLQYTFIKWSQCSCGTEIQYYITRDGGHSWPGGSQTVIGDPPSTYINANDLMWDFFQLHKLNCDSLTSISENVISKNTFSVFPNPTSSTTTISCKEKSAVTIYDSLGKMVFHANEFIGSMEFDFGNYTDGLYLIHSINFSQEIQYKKLIKQSKK